MAPKGWKSVWIAFNESEWAYVQARSIAECRRPSVMVKSAALFYSKFGPWKLATTEIEQNNKIIDLPIKLKNSEAI